MKQTLFLVVGLPGSGKSTYAKNFIKAYQDPIEYLSSDELRAVFGTSEEDQSVTPKVFNFIKEKVDEYLKNGKNVLIDATNINRKDRKSYIETADKYNARKVAIVFNVPKETLIQRNIERGNKGGRNVPEWVIDKMLSKYEPPTESEGFNVIYTSK